MIGVTPVRRLKYNLTSPYRIRCAEDLECSIWLADFLVTMCQANGTRAMYEAVRENPWKYGTLRKTSP